MKSKKVKSIEWWLRKIDKKGFHLNNLFQRHDGQYQANFRAKDNRYFTTFGYGDTPQEAIRNSMKNKSAIRAVTKPVESSITTTKRRRPKLPKKAPTKLPKGMII